MEPEPASEVSADDEPEPRLIHFKHTLKAVDIGPWLDKLSELPLGRALTPEQQAELDRVLEECDARGVVVHEEEGWPNAQPSEN
jgi:hypothetical protein